MALTLLEARKLRPDPLRDVVIEIFARESDILRVLPFDMIPGGGVRFNQESGLPGSAFRGINEGYTESTGTYNPVTEPLAICGGDIDVDRAIVKMMGEAQRERQEAMKLKAVAGKWSQVFIKGDAQSNPKEYDGLQARATGAQLINAKDSSPTDGGDPLSLGKLDQLKDAVDRPTHWLMSKAMRRKLSAAARTTTVGGHVNFEPDEFGRRQMTYDDLPILIADSNDNAFPALAFDEIGSTGSTATATSIYCLALADGMLTGIQNDEMEVVDLGELDASPVFRTRVEWLAGIAAWHTRCFARLRGVSDAAIIA